MTEGKCAIWGTKADKLPYDIVNSPRAGGKYKLTREASEDINFEKLNEDQKGHITSWLVEQRLSGVSIPELTEHVVKKEKNRNSISTTERIRRFFLCGKDFGWRVGKHTIYKLSDAPGVPQSSYSLLYAAYTESFSSEDANHFFDFLVSQQYLLSNGYITFKTFDEIDRLANSNANSKQAFVAMWFDPSLNEAYDKGIEPAIREAGYEPRIIRNKEHNNKIDDEIIAEIRHSKFVIADFTCGFSKDKSEAVARGGVYYEAGFAQGLNLPVIWTCREDIISHVHFDTRQYNHIVWSNPEDLREKLLNRIRATIT